MRRAGILVLLTVVWLGGCETASDDDTEVIADQSTPIDLSDPEVHVETVNSIEIGRTRDGFVLTAFGTAPALGYGKPRLRAHRDGRIGADGFLDFDLIAKPPEPGLERGRGSAAVRKVRADLVLDDAALLGVVGIRVHAVTGGAQIRF